MNDPRGAIWRKWDLHFHTPSSYDYKDKSVTNQEIIDNLHSNQVEVVAITDHHTINITRIKELQTLGDDKVTVLPGIEFRAELGGSESIHFIGLFPENSDIKDIWIKLQAQCGLTEKDVGDKGGDEKIHCDLEDTCKLIHALGGIASIHAGGKSNSIENITNTLPYKMALKTDLVLNHIDILELGNEEDQNDYNTIVFPSIKYSLPMIICTDNHNIRNYTFKQNLWIKADPTFEGLKQILYEPRERVKIQEEKPQEKVDYLVIDKARFVDTTGNKDFSDQWIKLNQNMNVIIGGKSSGKSLLLYHIAKAIDPSQVEEKLKIVKMNVYQFESNPDFDFELMWLDGYKNSFHENEENKTRPITYIPQMYINLLAEEKGEKKLKELIESILKQNTSFKDFADTKRKEIQECGILINQLINELFQLRGQALNILAEIKAIGDKKAIESQIKQIKGKMENLRKLAGFSEVEDKKYEKLIRKKEFQERQIIRFSTVSKRLEEYSDFIEQLELQNVDSINTRAEGLSNTELDDLLAQAIYERMINNDRKSLASVFESIKKNGLDYIKKIKQKIVKHKTKLDVIIEQLKPFLAKIQNQKLLEKLFKELDVQNKKLAQILEKEKTYLEIAEKGIKTKKGVIEKYLHLFECYKKIRDELSKSKYNEIGPDLELKVSLGFNINDFANSFSYLFDRRSSFNTTFGDSFQDNEFVYDENKHLDNIKEIFNKLAREEKLGIKMKAGFGWKDATLKLFEDYFQFKYNISQNNDDILKMSPGKRGLVLLQLLLHLSNAEHPILIDQPEDNLDNRTIYNELNQFMKDKKIDRQIIIVTHNANLAVSTDAEQIIVANQEGQVHGKDNREFSFEYVTGTLEYSYKEESAKGILYQMGIREHVCDILEGGQDAFENREKKYGFKTKWLS